MKKDKLKTFNLAIRVFLIGSAAFGLRLMPTIGAYLKRGERVFLGINSLSNLWDIWTYWGEMMMGKRGNLLPLKGFGLDPQKGYFIRPFYLYLGHLARILSLPVEILYLLAAYFLTVGLVWAVFCFSGYFFKKLNWRFGVVLVVLFSGPPNFFINVESVPFLSLLEPHFVLVFIFWILLAGLFFECEKLGDQNLRRRKWLMIFLVGLLLSTVHLFINWLLVALFFFWYLVSLLRRHEGKKLIPPLLALAISSLPMTFYLFDLSRKDPFFQYWLKSNVLYTPSLINYFLRLGFFLFLIPFSFGFAKKNQRVLFLVVWFLSQPLFIYFPVGWRRRFMEGWWLACSFLGALGISYFWEKARQKRAFLISLWVIFSFLIPGFLIGNLSLLFYENRALVFRPRDYYDSRSSAEAWVFLLPRCDFSKIIFTDLQRGAYLPAKTGCRTNIGHPHLTFNFSQRLAEVEGMTQGELEPVEMAAYFQEKGIDYVFLEKTTVQKAGIEQVENLEIIFENKEFVVYERVF